MSPRRSILGAVLAGVMMVLPACGDGGDGGETAAAGADGGAAGGAGTGAGTDRAGGAVADEVSGPRIDVVAKDISLDPDEFTVAAGRYTVTYVNEGVLEHTLLIEGRKGLDLLVRRRGDRDHGVVNLEPGQYVFYCDVPGHRAAGMEAELTVQ